MRSTSSKFTRLLATSALLLATAACASDAGVPCTSDNRDVVRDANGKIVHSTNGNCVRTQWMNDYDACKGERTFKRVEKTVFFDFNRSVLTPKAKTELNVLANSLKANQSVQSIKVIGYADRIGSNAYNEKLSQKRAEAVRNYLVTKGYANASATEVRWMGKNEPKTNCPAKTERKKLVKCLQGDRRVEVEVEYVGKE